MAGSGVTRIALSNLQKKGGNQSELEAEIKKVQPTKKK